MLLLCLCSFCGFSVFFCCCGLGVAVCGFIVRLPLWFESGRRFLSAGVVIWRSVCMLFEPQVRHHLRWLQWCSHWCWECRRRWLHEHSHRSVCDSCRGQGLRSTAKVREGRTTTDQSCAIVDQMCLLAVCSLCRFCCLPSYDFVGGGYKNTANGTFSVVASGSYVCMYTFLR